MPEPLHPETLAAHAARGVTVPAYDRAALRGGVVHIGVGSFHRSHQAVYFDDLAATGDLDWGITGVGLHRRVVVDALDAQDGLYTVVTRGAQGTEARVVGALQRCLFAPDDPEAVVAALADPRTRLVTLTITPDGYRLDLPAERGGPRSAIAFLVRALDRRRRAGLPPFTVLSCDNVPDNGALARAAVVGLAAGRDLGLATWIDEQGAFPSSMVDRITPQTTPEDVAALQRDSGLSDRWPVVTEPFAQWVVEDRFCAGRPPLDRVGVRFVDDVRPYALAKTRLLNATHCALGPLGALSGHVRIDEAMADPLLAAYVERLMAHEVLPLLPDLPGIDLDAYVGTLLERLHNPAIGDRLDRLSRNGAHKQRCHVVPSLAAARAAGRPHAALLLAVAAHVHHTGEDDVVTGDPVLRGEVHALVDTLAREGVRPALAAVAAGRPTLRAVA